MAKELIAVVHEFMKKTDKIQIAIERLEDECYTEDGIHLTNKTLANMRGKTK